MVIKTIYKYTRKDGGTTVTPNKPEGEYTELYRVIADEGKAVTKDGVNLYRVIDTESNEGWLEVDAPEVDESAMYNTANEGEVSEELPNTDAVCILD